MCDVRCSNSVAKRARGTVKVATESTAAAAAAATAAAAAAAVPAAAVDGADVPTAVSVRHLQDKAAKAALQRALNKWDALSLQQQLDALEAGDGKHILVKGRCDT